MYINAQLHMSCQLSSQLSCSQFMVSLQLEPASIFPEPQKLPEALLEKCAAISVKPDAIKDLIDAMQCMYIVLYCIQVFI